MMGQPFETHPSHQLTWTLLYQSKNLAHSQKFHRSLLLLWKHSKQHSPSTRTTSPPAGQQLPAGRSLKTRYSSSCFIKYIFSDVALQYTAFYMHIHSSKCSPYYWKDKVSVKQLTNKYTYFCPSYSLITQTCQNYQHDFSNFT